jgi:hypothetical protein
MINKTLTSHGLTDYTASSDFPGAINDTFIAGTSVYFICPRLSLNTLISESITSGNISSYTLVYEIFESLQDYLDSETPILFGEIALSSLNIINDSLVVELEDSKTLNNDYLYDEMTENEIYSLTKTYKIVFNVNTGTRDSDKDIIQDLHLILNASESGPYSVKFEEIEYLHPDDFTSSERINYSNDNPYTQGEEKVRSFYPESLTNCPLFVFQHGNGQETESYDFYLSSLASYGYFCISLYNPSQDIVANGISNLKLVDFIKQNKTKIRNSVFNIVDFSKIVLSGHSRGGGAAISSYFRLKNKNNINSVIADITISKTDIKCLPLFAEFSFDNITNQNILISGEKYTDSYILNLQAEDKEWFSPKLNDIPVLHILPCEDIDVTQQNSIHPTYRGFCYDIKRNYNEIEIITSSYGSHNSFSEFYLFNAAEEATLSSYPLLFQRIEDKITYNTLKPIQNSYLSELLYFCAANVYSSDKIRKLKYYQKYHENLKIISDKSNYIDKISFIRYSDIKYLLDSYQGLTLSYAGFTGFTFTAIGHTYDYCLDNSIYDRAEIAGVTAVNLSKENEVNPLLAYPRGLYNFYGYTLTDNDTFNGIFHGNYKGLFLPIESNCILGYTFSTGLSLAENDYLCLRGCLKYFYPITSGNTLDANFQIELKDSNLNTAVLSSKILGGGFKKPYRVSENIISNYERIKVPTLMTNVYFRVGDFYLKNTSLGITNINEITIRFGPDYGSTYAHLMLDEFIVIKEI